ncbi:antibiotic biosynthesis monooxygenase family protein [Peribacillus deserti]|uniref:Antibiotic biosynthesis monooxygenase n=1 Tax=Peribacillus deserti TaxID=673318 RepID=A0A2N5M3G5_9BACI|nr:antibiotic biosynthesis monooxygenase [Peribacillus deserti]PLT28865.1 antibiotic biosynthesis monooxygenase [Peribacillus deserti]
MFVQVRNFTVTQGTSEQVVNRFGKAGLVEEQKGFIDLTVLVKKVRCGDEKVIVLIRWESEEHWKQWEKSDAHIAGHKANLDKPKPDYILSTSGGSYGVKAVKEGENEIKKTNCGIKEAA